MSFRNYPQILTFVLLLALLIGGCAPLSREGQFASVVLQVQLNSAYVLEAQAFPVKVLGASLHPAREKQEQGWQQLPITRSEIDLLSARTVPATVAEGLLAPGLYDLAFVVLGDAHLDGQTRFQENVQTIVEPIGAFVDLGVGQQVTFTIHLAVLPFPQSPQKLALYAVDATISRGR